MKITLSCKNVADLLKAIVNDQCVDGFEWYPGIRRGMVSLYDLTYAIEVLEKQPDREMKVEER